MIESIRDCDLLIDLVIASVMRVEVKSQEGGGTGGVGSW